MSSQGQSNQQEFQRIQPQDQQIQNKGTSKQLTFVVPNDKKKLLACDNCHLIKTQDQWIKSKCQNCKGKQGGGDGKKNTSNKFEGVFAIIDPSKSWLKRRLIQNSKHVVSGVYAVDSK